MLKIILVSHGELARELTNSAKMIIGDDVNNLTYLCLHPSDNPETLTNQIKEIYMKAIGVGDEVLVLVDIKGGSPMISALSSMATLESCDKKKISVVTGCNLGMVIEIVTRLKYEQLSSFEAAKLVVQVGKLGIGLIHDGKEVEV